MRSTVKLFLREMRKRFLPSVVALTLIATFIPAGAASAETATAEAEVSPGVNTVQINETVTNGFVHPGIGLTKSHLETVRDMIAAKKEPWYSYYLAMAASTSASKTVKPNNWSETDPTKPANDAFDSRDMNSRFIPDGTKAYVQALMYVFTGDETYRANAMAIIRLWSQMDPAKAAPYSESYIHFPPPFTRLLNAAEIMRSTTSQTAELQWTDEDTNNLINNFIDPSIEHHFIKPEHFMNQHMFPVMGAMAGYIFKNDREGYNETVELYTVDSRPTQDQGFNGSIKQLFRLVDRNDLTGEPAEPRVQLVEMGRDQAHGAIDFTLAEETSRMMLAQGTKVDPVDGTASTADNAVGPYEFLDDRVFAAVDHFWQFMNGHDTPWTPVAYAISPDGTIRDTYNYISEKFRGRHRASYMWGMYYYYTYTRGINVAEKAPHYYQAFVQRIPSIYPYQGSTHNVWDGWDFGGDYWLYIPKEAEAEGTQYVPLVRTNPFLYEIEDRYTAFDSNTSVVQEGDAAFIRFNATETGSKIAVMHGGTSNTSVGFKVRTNGVAKLEVTQLKNTDAITLPDTKGQWIYVTLNKRLLDLIYLTVKGSGIMVDLDHIHLKGSEVLTPPQFKSGDADLQVFSYAGAPISIDFAAADSGATDVVAYESANLPADAALNTSTGAFSWTPLQAGTHSFYIGASDGTTVSTKNVTIKVTNDRASAVDAVVERYDPNTAYVASSLENYKAVYNETLNMINSASDEAFAQQLLTLGSLVEALELLTPLTKFDGIEASIDYSKIASSPTLDAALIPGLVDNDVETGSLYSTAHYPNLYHILDFGIDFKVSANKFGFQSNIFSDRIANSTVFGSNDGATWTRLSPGAARFTQEYNTIDAYPELANEKYRFIKVQMIKVLPDVLCACIRNQFEFQEFHIYGERHETGNKIKSISLSSDQSSKGGRTPLGSTVKVTVQAKEAIQNVKVEIQGVEATVSTTDHINWTASATMTGVPTGDVKVKVDHQRNDGTNGDTIYGTTDKSSLYLVDDSDLITNVTSIANLIDSTSGRTAAQTLKSVNYLFDGNPTTNSDFRNGSGGNGQGAYITFDFKQGNQVTLSSVEVLAWDRFVGRISGLVVQGSNDNTTWTTLTPSAVTTTDWQTLSTAGSSAYRYIRIYNPNTWYGNMAELRFHGMVISPLRDALNQAAAIDRDIYTLDSLQALDTAVSAGNALLVNDDATQTDIDIAVNHLKIALEGLTYIPGIPVLQTLTDHTVKAGNKLAFPVKAVNTDEAVTYAVSALPAGASFDAAAQNFEWTPGIDQSGVYHLTFTATAGDLTSSKTIMIKVIGQPVVGAADPVAWTAKQKLTYQVPISDPSGEPLVYSAEQLPAGSALNGLTGEFTWTPTQADYGSHPVTFSASNGSYSVNVIIVFDVKLLILPAADYTKGSYDLYRNEITRIHAEMDQPGADTAKLAAEIDQTETLLVRVPLSLYSFEGNTDNTYGSTTASAPGSPAYSEGKVGQALSLDGSTDYVQLPADHPLSAYNEITIATWVNWKGGSQWQRIFDFGNSTSQYMFLTPRSNNGTLRFAIKNGGGEQVVQTSILPTNQWVHVAVTLGDRTAKLYVNGELKATNADFTIKPSDFNPSVNYIGKSQWPDPLFKGMIDEFSIFNHVLSADEIGNLVANGTQWVDKSLLGNLLDQASNIVADQYTADSSAIFQTAYENAKTVAANADAAQADIDAASSSLDTAMKGLEYWLKASVDPAAPNGLNGWYTNPVAITLSTYGTAEYKVNDEASWHAYTAPIVFDQDGEYTVSYRSKNNAGVTGAVQTVMAYIDRAAPATAATVDPAAPNSSNGWYTSNVTVSLSATDNLSGEEGTEYSLDGGSTWQAYSAPITLNQESKYTLSYRSIDIAGNAEAVRTIALNLDATAPTITVSGVVNGTLVDSLDITPTITLNDSLSGIDEGKTKVTLDGNGMQQGTTIPLYTLSLGSHTLIVEATDLAGNTSSYTVVFQTTASIESLQALVERFETAGWIDNGGIADSLQSMLAKSNLTSFVNLVRAQNGKHISDEAADYLLRDAEYLLSVQ